MVGIQLSREPVVRQTIRQTYSERSKVSVKPTKKGKKVMTFHVISDRTCKIVVWSRKLMSGMNVVLSSI